MGMDDLGKNIRVLRRQRALTLRQMAQTTGLSVSFLSEIERGRSQPSMASLKKIRKALGISLLDLQDRDIAPDELETTSASGFAYTKEAYIRDARVVRADQRKKIAYPGRPGFYELLTPDLKRRLEVLYFKMASDFDTGSEVLLDPPGEKCMILLAGEVEFRVGDQVFHLSAGDALSYPADAPISWTVKGNRPFEGILVITPPNF